MPVANDGGVGAIAEGEPKGVDDDGFACPGFAADDGEPVLGLQFQLVNGGKMTNAQVCQHGVPPEQAKSLLSGGALGLDDLGAGKVVVQATAVGPENQ